MYGKANAICSGILHRILTAPRLVGYFSCLAKELVTRLNFGSASAQAAHTAQTRQSSAHPLAQAPHHSSPKLSPVFGPSLLLATRALPTSAVPHELCQLYAKVSGGPVLGTPGSQNRATHKNRSPNGALNPHAWRIWSRMLHLPCNMATSSAVDVRAALSSLFRGSGRPTWPRPWHVLAFGQ